MRNYLQLFLKTWSKVMYGMAIGAAVNVILDGTGLWQITPRNLIITGFVWIGITLILLHFTRHISEIWPVVLAGSAAWSPFYAILWHTIYYNSLDNLTPARQLFSVVFDTLLGTALLIFFWIVREIQAERCIHCNKKIPNDAWNCAGCGAPISYTRDTQLL